MKTLEEYFLNQAADHPKIYDNLEHFFSHIPTYFG